jgi:hypothetical protein
MIYLLKAASCLLFGFVLMWKATHRPENESRLRFIFGMLALTLFALGVASWPVAGQIPPNPIPGRTEINKVTLT